MKPGQVLTRWWQDYCAGRLMTPRAIRTAALLENPDPARAEKRWMDIPMETSDWKPVERMKAPTFIGSNAHIKLWDRADWSGSDPRLMYWAALFQEMARKRGVPLYVHTAYRGRAEQEAVNKAGNSKAGFGRSPHNIGEAVDIVHGVYHWMLTPGEWETLHVLGRLALDRVNAQLTKEQKLHLTWGGDFKSLYDPAHWEITDFRKRLGAPVGGPIRRTPRSILSDGLLVPERLKTAA